MTRQRKPYCDPYLAGIGIGLVLLAAYVVAGRGLGASGAFSSLAAALNGLMYGSTVAASAAATAPYLRDGISSPLRDWLVLELIGVAAGGFVSARLAGRTGFVVEGGSSIRNRTRLLAGFGGGLLMAFGAKLARGCTSGQALTGGALLSVGSWIFIAACFAAGYAMAPFARRLWR
jgi:hypothetical protein